MRKLRLPCLLLMWALAPALPGCAGPNAARNGDEALLTEEEGLRDPPVRGATRPPPTFLDDEPRARAAQVAPVGGDRAAPGAEADGAINVMNVGRPDEEPPPAGEAAPAHGHDRDRGKAGQVPYASPRGTIRRADLVALLDQQPAAFLRKVESEPRFENGRFRGWAIHAFFSGDTRFAGIDLQSGDVVTRINGRPIEQPDQFIQVWEDLRQARELRLDVLRNGQAHVSRWSIVD